MKGMDIYKRFWARIGGRPWTFIIRDWWHNYEGLWIIALVACGAIAHRHFGLVDTLIALGIFALGYIGGHLFWGKKYIPNQDKKE